MRDHSLPDAARLTSSSYDPEHLVQALSVFLNATVPAARSRRGYRGCVALVNRDLSRLMSMTFWSADAEHDEISFDPGSLGAVPAAGRSTPAPLVQETFSVYVCELRHLDRLVSGSAHARLTTMQVNSRYWDALIGAGQEAVGALEDEQPGFIGAIGLGNRANGRATFVELWQNRAALRASEATAYRQERAARAVRMLVGVPQHSSFVIEHLEVGGGAKAPGDCDDPAPGVE